MHSDGLFRLFPNQFRFVGESICFPMLLTPAGCCLGLPDSIFPPRYCSEHAGPAHGLAHHLPHRCRLHHARCGLSLPQAGPETRTLGHGESAWLVGMAHRGPSPEERWFHLALCPSGALHSAGTEEAEGAAPVHAALGARGLTPLWLCLLPSGRVWGAHHVRQEHEAQLLGTLQLCPSPQHQLD